MQNIHDKEEIPFYVLVVLVVLLLVRNVVNYKRSSSSSRVGGGNCYFTRKVLCSIAAIVLHLNIIYNDISIFYTRGTRYVLIPVISELLTKRRLHIISVFYFHLD